MEPKLVWLILVISIISSASVIVFLAFFQPLLLANAGSGLVQWFSSPIRIFLTVLIIAIFVAIYFHQWKLVLLGIGATLFTFGIDWLDPPWSSCSFAMPHTEYQAVYAQHQGGVGSIGFYDEPVCLWFVSTFGNGILFDIPLGFNISIALLAVGIIAISTVIALVLAIFFKSSGFWGYIIYSFILMAVYAWSLSDIPPLNRLVLTSAGLFDLIIFPIAITLTGWFILLLSAKLIK